jgi:hypothetical protein
MMLGVVRGVYCAAAMLPFGGGAFQALLRAKLPVMTPLQSRGLRTR